nr:protein PSY3-like [Ipomoea batatas]
MGVGFRLCICLLFASAIISSSARNTISISGDEMLVVEMEGRSMEMRVDDYGEATTMIPGTEPAVAAAGAATPLKTIRFADDSWWRIEGGFDVWLLGVILKSFAYHL